MKCRIVAAVLAVICLTGAAFGEQAGQNAGYFKAESTVVEFLTLKTRIEWKNESGDLERFLPPGLGEDEPLRIFVDWVYLNRILRSNAAWSQVKNLKSECEIQNVSELGDGLLEIRVSQMITFDYVIRGGSGTGIQEIFIFTVKKTDLGWVLTGVDMPEDSGFNGFEGGRFDMDEKLAQLQAALKREGYSKLRHYEERRLYTGTPVTMSSEARFEREFYGIAAVCAV